MNLELTRLDDAPTRARLFGEPPPIRPLDDEFDPIAVARIVRRRFWVIVATAVLVFAAALPAIMAIEPRYRAEARVLIQTPLAAAIKDPEDKRFSRLNLVTEIERLGGREISAAVIERLGLGATEEFNPALREPSVLARLKDRVRAPALGPDLSETLEDPLEPILAEYAAALSLERDPASDVVSIGFTSRNRRLAAAVPGAVLEAYLREREAHLQTQIDHAGEWLDARLSEQRARARAARIAAEEEEDWTSSASEIGETMAALIAQRAAAAQRRAEVTASLAALDGARAAGSDAMPVDDPIVAELIRDLLRLRQERERLGRIFGDRHPTVVDAEAAVADMQARIAAEVDRHRESLLAALAVLDRKDEATDEAIDAAQAALAREERAEARRRELRRTAEDEQTALRDLEEHARALEASRKLPVADIEMLTPASLPLSPTGRGRLFYAAVALIAAGMLGATAAGVVEIADRSVRSLQQLRGLGAFVPAAMLPRLPRRLARQIASRLDPHGDGAYQQAVRVLALALQQSNGGRPPPSVLVTSAAPEEGKTLTATALALEFAAGRGLRVLLVDADLRRGRIHQLFGAAPGPGLSDALAGACKFEDVVRRSPVERLDYISRGARKAQPFGDDVGERIVEFGEAAYDMVLIDGLPALASGRALSLARDVARVVFVARWGRTRLSSIELAADRLEVVLRDRALIVINGVDPKRHALYGFRDADLFLKSLRRYQQEGST